MADLLDRLGRSYGRTPAELLQMPWEDLIVTIRCYLQGRREDADYARSLRRDKIPVFITHNASRGA